MKDKITDIELDLFEEIMDDDINARTVAAVFNAGFAEGVNKTANSILAQQRGLGFLNGVGLLSLGIFIGAMCASIAGV